MAMPIKIKVDIDPNKPHFVQYESKVNEVTGEVKPFTQSCCVICGSNIETENCVREIFI